MAKQIDDGKFGLEIPALTKARVKAEAESYSPQSRTDFHNALQESRELVEKVEAFLEKNGAPAVSACGSDDMFGVITSAESPDAPCGISFYGPSTLAQAVADAFPANKVISAHDGAVVTPAVATMPKQAGLKPGSRQ